MADELMNPRGTCRYETKPLTPRFSDLSGKVLGLVDNSKDNADLFLNHVLDFLRKKYSLRDVLRLKKSASAVPAPFTPEFFDRCDLAINAFGD